MKKLFVGLVFLALMPMQACAQVKLWEEGRHYTVISEQATAKPEVKEYFSFWCPACFRFEPLVDELKTALPDGVDFKKVHVNFMRFSSPQVQDFATQAMVVGKQLGREKEMMEAIFNYIHVQQKGTSLASLDDFKAIFVSAGVDAGEFDKLAKSFAVKSLVNKNNKQVAEKRQYLSGVPNFIVNGKYQVEQGSVTTAQEFIDLVIWLTNQP